ncbi:hypothetical protein [Nostoc sp.]|uniref:hypothetical protein n=1 Tax=Nostoc sp. TaxID=1180 RepID=UPI003FA54B49
MSSDKPQSGYALSIPLSLCTTVLSGDCHPEFSTSLSDLHRWFCSSLALSCGGIAINQKLGSAIAQYNCHIYAAIN